MWVTAAYTDKFSGVNMVFATWTSWPNFQSQKGCVVRFEKNYRAEEIHSEKYKGFLGKLKESFGYGLASPIL